MPNVETTQKRLLRALTKKPLLGSEIAEKMKKTYPNENYGDPRSFGIALGKLVKAGEVVKHAPTSRPRYSKP